MNAGFIMKQFLYVVILIFSIRRYYLSRRLGNLFSIGFFGLELLRTCLVNVNDKVNIVINILQVAYIILLSILILKEK